MSFLEIAKVAGVSTATVSRVLNHSSKVDPALAAAVHSAVDELNYKHTPRRRRSVRGPEVARQRRSEVFALIGPDTQTAFSQSLQHGFGSAADEINHRIMVCSTSNDVHKQADIFLQLMDKNVAGVALIPGLGGLPPTHQIRQLQAVGVPVVLLHRSVEGVSAPLIELRGDRIGRMAGEAMAKHGHRVVAYIAPNRLGLAPIYEESLRRALAQHGGELPVDCVDYGDLNLFTAEEFLRYGASLQEKLETLMNRQPRPTAIFTSFETIAEGVYLGLQQMGLRIPEDVSLVTFGDKHRRGLIGCRLDSITAAEAQAGRLAAQWLDQMCRGERDIDNGEVQLVDLTFSAGATLGAPPEQVVAATA